MKRTIAAIATLLVAAMTSMTGAARAQTVPQVTLSGPISPAQRSGQWSWYPVQGAMCRHGGGTGFGAKLQPGSRKLVITMQGGGACFDGTTCALNVSSYGELEFLATLAKIPGFTALDEGLWKEGQSELAKFSQVYVPYCTGDLFAGNIESTPPNVVRSQQFRGYNNMKLFFAYIVRNFVPLLPSNGEIVLTGFSAGGFGATFNAHQLRDMLPSNIGLTVVDDSGPLFSNGSDKLMRGCFQKRAFDVWGVRTLLDSIGCTDCTETSWMSPFLKRFLTKYPDVRYVFTSSTYDSVIRTFMSIPELPCAYNPGVAEYTDGLLQIRALMDSTRGARGNVATFFGGQVSNTNHCALHKPLYYTLANGNGESYKNTVEMCVGERPGVGAVRPICSHAGP